MHITKDIINTYLYFGYLLPDNLSDDLLSIWEKAKINYDYTVEEAVAKFDSLFDNIVETNHSQNYIVPLSGGWDSRAILGALFERVEHNRIKTISFGVPGQLDYDVAQLVSKHLQLEHHSIDLRSVEITWNDLIETTKRSPWTYMPDAFYNSMCRNYLSNKNDSILIGFLGDALTGNHIKTANQNLFGYFLKSQKRINNINIHQNEFIYKLNNKFSQYLFNQENSYDILDICIRQAKCIAPIVLPLKRWNVWNSKAGFETNGSLVIAPFADKEWARYWLNAPFEKRFHQKLYLDLLRNKFKELFELPSKYSYGTKPEQKLLYKFKKYKHVIKTKIQNKYPNFRINSNIMTNYIDYDDAFRNRVDFKNILKTAFETLEKGDFVPWLNLNNMWYKHMKRKANYGDAFVVLTGLAANLSIEILNSFCSE